ncbi:hypothetical protein J2S46_007736 [Kitasatospora herbaricolor]|uniref:scabin-related ADP-ribosyltransferase n=1 Tax=Kitasatospora herbaricolor TaxID=68217 RepID=UPI0027933948|nr:toxin glutamine deamidase domain-containing protein [Kitasatospora herbaricolor]MDQ0313180.1 hypothetical protein [Kitasatospora herbaricolor]
MAHSSIQVSPGVATFFHILTGMPWPESDEGLLRDVRDDYAALAEDLPKLRGYVVDLVARCRSQFEGEAAEGFAREMGRFVGDDGTDYLATAGQLAGELGEFAGKVANTVEYTKWMIIGQIVQLLVEIALAIAFFPFTFGASMAAAEGLKQVVKTIIINLLKKLVQVIVTHTLFGVVGGLVMDAILQGIQFGQGNRHEWDKDLTKQAAIMGAISGAVAGPLHLLGMGLGKLLGAGLAKIFVTKELGNLVKELGAGAAGGAAGGAAKGLGKEAGRLVANEAASEFAKNISKLLKENSRYLGKGFGAGGKVGAAAGARFAENLGKVFEKGLGKELGTRTARELGERFGKTFAENGAKSAAGRTALGTALREIAEGGSHAPSAGLRALAEKLPELAGRVDRMNTMFVLGHVLGEQIKMGTNQYLTEGFFNQIYYGEWSASGMSFLGGFMMGGARHMIMGLASPLTTKYVDFVRGLDSSQINPANGKYYGAMHPLTLLSAISNVAGHPAPFPVPRPGGHDQVPGGSLHLHGDDAAGSTTSLGAPPSGHRTEGGSDASGSDRGAGSGSGAAKPQAPEPGVVTESGGDKSAAGPKDTTGSARIPEPAPRRSTESSGGGDGGGAAGSEARKNAGDGARSTGGSTATSAAPGASAAGGGPGGGQRPHPESTVKPDPDAARNAARNAAQNAGHDSAQNAAPKPGPGPNPDPGPGPNPGHPPKDGGGGGGTPPRTEGGPTGPKDPGSNGPDPRPEPKPGPKAPNPEPQPKPESKPEPTPPNKDAQAGQAAQGNLRNAVEEVLSPAQAFLRRQEQLRAAGAPTADTPGPVRTGGEGDGPKGSRIVTFDEVRGRGEGDGAGDGPFPGDGVVLGGGSGPRSEGAEAFLDRQETLREGGRSAGDEEKPFVPFAGDGAALGGGSGPRSEGAQAFLDRRRNVRESGGPTADTPGPARSGGEGDGPKGSRIVTFDEVRGRGEGDGAGDGPFPGDGVVLGGGSGPRSEGAEAFLDRQETLREGGRSAGDEEKPFVPFAGDGAALGGGSGPRSEGAQAFLDRRRNVRESGGPTADTPGPAKTGGAENGPKRPRIVTFDEVRRKAEEEAAEAGSDGSPRSGGDGSGSGAGGTKSRDRSTGSETRVEPAPTGDRPAADKPATDAPAADKPAPKPESFPGEGYRLTDGDAEIRRKAGEAAQDTRANKHPAAEQGPVLPSGGERLGGTDGTRPGGTPDAAARDRRHTATEQRRNDYEASPEGREHAEKLAQDAREAAAAKAEQQADAEARRAAQAEARWEALQERTRAAAEEAARTDQREAARQAAQEQAWKLLLQDLRDKSGGDSGRSEHLTLRDAQARIARRAEEFAAQGDGDGRGSGSRGSRTPADAAAARAWHELAAELGVRVESLEARGLMPRFPAPVASPGLDRGVHGDPLGTGRGPGAAHQPGRDSRSTPLHLTPPHAEASRPEPETPDTRWTAPQAPPNPLLPLPPRMRQDSDAESEDDTWDDDPGTPEQQPAHPAPAVQSAAPPVLPSPVPAPALDQPATAVRPPSPAPSAAEASAPEPSASEASAPEPSASEASAPEPSASEPSAPELTPLQLLPLPPLLDEPPIEGAFTADRLWRAGDHLPAFILYQGHEAMVWDYDLAEVTDDAQLDRMAAVYERAAEQVGRRLRRIVERAREEKDTDGAGRDAAETLLATYELLSDDGWTPAYISEFLRLQMLFRASDVPARFPHELSARPVGVVNGLVDPGAPLPPAPASPADPGRSLRGSDGASMRFYTWLDQKAGGNRQHLYAWGEAQSATSSSPESLQAKVLFAHFRNPGRQHLDDAYFWLNGLDRRLRETPGFRTEIGGEEVLGLSYDPVLLRSLAAQHVFTYEMLRTVRMPRVDRQAGTVRLIRLEQRTIEALAEQYEPGPTRRNHRPVEIRRGPAESFSLLTPYKDPEGGTFWLTMQTLPIHRVFGTHLQIRMDGPKEHSLYLGEDEFLAMAAGFPVECWGEDQPPLTAEEREQNDNAPAGQPPMPVTVGGPTADTGEAVPAGEPWTEAQTARSTLVAAEASQASPATVAPPPGTGPALLPPQAWAAVRRFARPARMSTTRFDPLVEGQPGSGAIAGPSLPAQYAARAPGGERPLGDLRGAMTRIDYDVRHFEARPGRWVREFTLRLDLKAQDGTSTSPEQVDRLWDEALSAVDQHVNGRFTLSDGAQFHLRIERADGLTDAHRTVRVAPGAGRSDQLLWYARSTRGVLVHELMHFLGLPDEYADSSTALRRTERFPGEPGVMGAAAHGDGFEVLPRHVRRIEDVLRSGPFVRELTFDRYRALSANAGHPAAAAPTGAAPGTVPEHPHHAPRAPRLPQPGASAGPGAPGSPTRPVAEVASRERGVHRAGLAVAGQPYEALTVPGDGDCLFTSLLVGAYRQFGGWEHQHLDVDGLREAVLHWYRGPEAAVHREAADATGQSALDALVMDLAPSRLWDVVGGTGPAPTHPDLLAPVRRDAALLLGDPGSGAWERLLATNPRLARSGLRDLGPERLRDMRPSEAVDLAIRDRDLWNTPFFDEVPRIAAAALGLNLGVLDSGGHHVDYLPDADRRTVLLYRQAGDEAHYSALRPVPRPEPLPSADVPSVPEPPVPASVPKVGPEAGPVPTAEPSPAQVAEKPALSAPPERLTHGGAGQLGGGDRVLPIPGPADRVLDRVVASLTAALAGDLPAAERQARDQVAEAEQRLSAAPPAGPRRVSAEQRVTRARDRLIKAEAQSVAERRRLAGAVRDQLSGALDLDALQPVLASLTQGELLALPFELDGWKGDIQVTATVVRAVTTKEEKKFEFEDGSDSFVTTGSFEEGRRRFGGGLLLGGKFTPNAPETSMAGQLGAVGDRSKAATVDSRGRTFSRSKTPEPALRIDADIRLGIDFSGVRKDGKSLPVGPGGAADRHRLRIDLPVPVVVPAAESADAVPPPGQRHYLPPLRVQQSLALGGTDVVKSVHIIDADGRRTGGGVPRLLAAAAPAAALPAGTTRNSLDAFGAETFGGDWAAVRAEILGRLDLLTLRTELKSMMNGEPVEILLSGERGHVLVFARVSEMTQLRTTGPTEFNTGTDVTRTVVASVTDSLSVAGAPSVKHTDFGQLPFGVTGSGSGQFGHDRSAIDRVTLRAGNAVKVKAAGVVFDGRAVLTFEYRPDGGSAGDHGTRATGLLGFQVLAEAADSVAADVSTPFRPGPVVPGPLVSPALPPGSTAWRPGPEIWQGGLPESAVVLDVLAGTGPSAGVEQGRDLHTALDELGVGAFRQDGWAGFREAVRHTFRRERLAASLPAMTRDLPLQGPLLSRPRHADTTVQATARVQRLEFLRTIDTAELNILNETAVGDAARDITGLTLGGQIQGGLHHDFPAGEWASASAGRGGSRRWRTGDRTAAGSSTVSSAKFPEPMAVYLATARLNVRLADQGGLDAAAAGPHPEVRFVVAVPQSRAASYLTEGPQAKQEVFTRPDPVVAPVPGHADDTPKPVDGAPEPAEDATKPAEETAEPPLPPERVARNRQLGSSDAVLTLTDGLAVVNRLRESLAPVFGSHWERVAADLMPYFDAVALRPMASALTSGRSWGAAVSAGGVTGEIRITGAAVTGLTYLKSVKDFEFEVGTETTTSTGLMHDERARTTWSIALAGKVPHLQGALSHAWNSDGVIGGTRDIGSNAVSKGKTVEAAAVFRGDLTFTVDVDLTRTFGLPGNRAIRHTLDATTGGEFAFPLRESAVAPGAKAKPAPAEPRHAPQRVMRSLVLGATDIVLRVSPIRPPEHTAVVPVHAPGAERPGVDADPQPEQPGDVPLQPLPAAPAPPRRPGAGHVLDQVDATGREVFGSDRNWRRVKEELAPKFTAEALQQRLRPLMAGQGWTIAVRGGTVTVRASVQDMVHVADTKATEFNSGSATGHSSGGTDGLTAYTRGSSQATALRIVGTSDPVGVLPAAVVAGGTLSHVGGRDHIAETSSAVGTGVGTKTKVPGSVFEGTALLHLEFRRNLRLWDRAVDKSVPAPARDEQRRIDAIQRAFAARQKDLAKRADELGPEAYRVANEELDAEHRAALRPLLDEQQQRIDESVLARWTADLRRLDQRIRDLGDRPGSEELRERYLAEQARHQEQIARPSVRRKPGPGPRSDRTPDQIAPMTRSSFAVRRNAFGYARVGFQALVETAETGPAANGADLRFEAPPAVTAGDGPPPAGRGYAPLPDPGPRTHSVPPARVWTEGFAPQEIRDLPDVGSLRSLLDTEGRRHFQGAWDSKVAGGGRRSERVMAEFGRERLTAALPRLTAGGELVGTPFQVKGRSAWVSVTAEVVDLAHLREEAGAEVALVGEASGRRSRRVLTSRHLQVMGQVGAEFSKLRSKFSTSVLLGGGYRRRQGGERSAGGRTIANSKVPVPLVHFEGHVAFRFAFHRAGEAAVSTGVVPFVVSVPKAEVARTVEAPGDTYFTAVDREYGRRWPGPTPARAPRPVPEPADAPKTPAESAGDPPNPGTEQPGTDNSGGRDTARDTDPNVGPGAAPDVGGGSGPAPAGRVLAPDGRSIPDADIRTRTITDEHGRSIGRAVFHDGDWALREGAYRRLRALGTYELRAAAGQPSGGAVRPVPWDPEHAYFYAGHADRAGFDLRLTDGSGVSGVGAGQVAGLLRRRPSVAALRAAAASGRPASIVLLGCESAEHAQAVAEVIGLPVHAPTGRTGVSAAAPGAGPGQPPTLYVKPAPGGAEGEFRTFVPGGPGGWGAISAPATGGPSGSPVPALRSGGPGAGAPDNTPGNGGDPSQRQGHESLDGYGEFDEYGYFHIYEMTDEHGYRHPYGGFDEHGAFHRYGEYGPDGWFRFHQQAAEPAQGPVELWPQALAAFRRRNVELDQESAGELRIGFVPEVRAAVVDDLQPGDATAAAFDTIDTELVADDAGTPLRWRVDDSLLFRWESERALGHLGDIFEQGFVPRAPGQFPTLQEYKNANTPSAFVSTTRSEAGRFDEWGTAYRFLIDAPGGIDVRRTFPDSGLAELEDEVAFPGGVRSKFIVGAEVVDGTGWGEAPGRYATPVTFVPNPHYRPDHRLDLADVLDATDNGTGRPTGPASPGPIGPAAPGAGDPGRTDPVRTDPAQAGTVRVGTVPSGRGRVRHVAEDVRFVEVSPQYAERVLGVPVRNQEKFQRVADRRGIVIEVRPTNPDSVPHLDAGALPKPKAIKAKTVNEEDIWLGAKAEDKGLVGFFRPVLPERPAGMGDGLWNRVLARFDQRTVEFAELAPVMRSLAGEFRVVDGVVQGRDRQGAWKPITGDHDIFDLQDAEGFRIGADEYGEAVEDMVGQDMGVQHGAHMFWQPESAFDRSIFEKIVKSHEAGGEALIRFVPGLERPVLGTAEPEQPSTTRPGRAHLGGFAGDPRRHAPGAVGSAWVGVVGEPGWDTAQGAPGEQAVPAGPPAGEKPLPPLPVGEEPWSEDVPAEKPLPPLPEGEDPWSEEASVEKPLPPVPVNQEPGAGHPPTGLPARPAGPVDRPAGGSRRSAASRRSPGDDVFSVLVPAVKRRAGDRAEDQDQDQDRPEPKRLQTMDRHVTPAADRGLVAPTGEQEQAWLDTAPDGPVLRGTTPLLTEGLLGHINPDRSTVNCVDANLALWDTMDGDPHPAGTRPDGMPERDAVREVTRRLGPPWHYGSGATALEKVVALVRGGGPGARALVLFAEQGQVGHARTLLHTGGGVLRWIDPQLGEFPEHAPEVSGTAGVWAYAEDAGYDQIRGDGEYDGTLFHDPATGEPGRVFGMAGPERLFPRHPVADQPGWKERAEAFEQRVAELATSVAAREGSAVGLALRHLAAILAYHHGPDWNEDLHLMEVFTRDDVTSAGQIGHAALTVRATRKMMASGNPRERYTAFYNGAYYRPDGDRPYIGGLKELLVTVFQEPEMLTAQALGLDVARLRSYRDHLLSAERRTVRRVLDVFSPQHAGNYSDDPFALGNLTRWSADPVGDTAELGRSQVIRTRRADEMTSPARLTPGRLRRAGIGLSRRELALLREREVLPISLVESREVDTLPLTAQGELDTARIFPEWQTVSDAQVRTAAPDAEGNVRTTVTAHVSGRMDLRASDLTEMTLQEIEEAVAANTLEPDDPIPERQGPEFPLGSIEGAARFRLDPDSRWHRELDARGMPAIGGLSGTAARMLSAFDWLNVEGARREDFVIGLIGWMLLQRDHSLYEILRGVQIAGFNGVEGRTFDLTDAVSMYRSLDALGPDLAEERLRELDPMGLLPHERHYRDRLAVKGVKGGLYGLSTTSLRDAEDFYRAQLDPAPGAAPTDRRVLSWLADHGIPVPRMRESLAGFGPAQFAAVRAYTGNDHILINLVVERTRGFGSGLPVIDVVAAATRLALKDMIRKKHSAQSFVETNIFFLDREVKALMDERGLTDPAEQQAVDAKLDRRITQLLPSVVAESKLHAAMLMEALDALPVAREMTVYRGAWEWGSDRNLSAFVAKFFAKEHLEFDTYASTSKKFTTALTFATKDPVGAYRHRVVYMLRLRGGSGRDITPFSQKRGEAEVLLLPGARFRVTGRTLMPHPSGDSAKDYVLIEAEEVVPPAAGVATTATPVGTAPIPVETQPAPAHEEESDSESFDDLLFLFDDTEVVDLQDGAPPLSGGGGPHGPTGEPGAGSAAEVPFLLPFLPPGVPSAGSPDDAEPDDAEPDDGWESGEEVSFILPVGVPYGPGDGDDDDGDDDDGDDDDDEEDDDDAAEDGDDEGDDGWESGEEVTFVLG